MPISQTLGALRIQGAAIRQLYEDVDAERARWHPAEGRWSLLEILCHLVDEERDDFRRRISSTLEDPARAWPPIDPEGWVVEREYARRGLESTLREFADERARSLEWLAGLEDPDWNRAFQHPKLGALRAGDLLASWLAHDLLHLRQIADTRRAWVTHRADPFSTAYAEP